MFSFRLPRQAVAGARQLLHDKLCRRQRIRIGRGGLGWHLLMLLLLLLLLLLRLLLLCCWLIVPPRVLLVLCCLRDGLIIEDLLCDTSISRHLITPAAREVFSRSEWL